MQGSLRHLVWRLAEPPAFLPPFAVQSIKVALASGLAWGLGQALHSPRPFNAVLAVIILMQVNAYGSLLNALEFVAGIAAGLVLGILADQLIGLSPPVLAAIIFICMLIGGWVKSPRNGLNNQIAISALLVLASGSSQNVDRLWETALGGLIGVAVAALVWPPNPVRRLRHECHVATERIKADVRRTVEIAGGGGDPEENRRHVRANSEHADAAVAAIAPAEDALRWNPWHCRRMHDLGRLEDRLRLISYLYRTVRALARQAAEAPRPEVDPGHDWDPGRPHLLAAGVEAVAAIEHRLDSHDVREPVRKGREAVGSFAGAAPQHRHAMALAAALDDLFRDVEGWRPSCRVNSERVLVARVARVRRRLGDGWPASLVSSRALRCVRKGRQDPAHSGVESRWARPPREGLARLRGAGLLPSPSEAGGK